MMSPVTKGKLSDTIAGIDLNLLKVFEAILAEGSVSRAAARLGLSQSATSHSLSRLREIVDDPLFERKGDGVRPTPKALELAGPILLSLQSLRTVLRKSEGVFDPRVERRTFTFDIPAGVDIVVAPELVRLAKDAPGLTFRIMTGRARQVMAELRFGHSALSIDFDAPQEKGYRYEVIEEDGFVAIARKEHPAFRRELTQEQFFDLPQVALTFARRDDGSPVTNRLGEAGIARQVRLVVSSLPSIATVIASSDLISMTSRRIATMLARQFDFDIHPLPVHMPPLPITMIWHEHFDADPGHVWLRDTIRTIFRGG
jgi:DNA-binding transcriptional LysR family regulator